MSHQDFVVINQAMAEEIGGIKMSVGKKNANGQIVMAVVSDAHFVNQNKISLPFNYHINDTLDDVIVLVKGSIDQSHLESRLNESLAELGLKVGDNGAELFNSKFEEFFSEELMRQKVTFVLLMLIFIFSLFAMSALASQWVELNKKVIAIKLALGLTVEKLWAHSAIVSCMVTLSLSLVALTVCAYVDVLFFDQVEWDDVLFLGVVFWLVFYSAMVTIFKININRIDGAFISNALQNG